MKIIIPQNILLPALEIGSLAAISEEAQNDTTALSLLIKCVKITVDNDITFESSTKLFSVRHKIKIVKDIDVKEKGSVLVPAKELLSWVNKQKSSLICFSLSKLPLPEQVNTDSSGNDHVVPINKIGSLKVASKDNSKTGNRWSIDCFESSQSILANFDNKPNVLFESHAENFLNSIKYVSFSSMPKHYEHVYDSILFEFNNNNLYVAACDTTRCALYKLDKLITVSDKINNSRVLIPCDYLYLISRILSNKENVLVFYDVNSEKVYISQENLEFRLSVADQNISKKFPSISVLINKDYDYFCEINREILSSRLSTASLVNKACALFTFNSADSTLKIDAISESGMAPSTSIAPVQNLKECRKLVIAINHLQDLSKIVKDENIIINMPRDNKSFKVTIKDCENFSYYAMSVNNSKYGI